MLTSLLTVRNWYWAEDRFCPPLDCPDIATVGEMVRLRGQFAAVMSEDRNGIVRLIRDPLGINKFFFAIERTGEVACANRMIDLIREGVPFEAIFSVPPGHMVELNVADRRLTLIRYFKVNIRAGGEHNGGLQEYGTLIRRELDTWFGRLARDFADRDVCICLSGGLDSGLIAAFAKKYFHGIRCYTYGFLSPNAVVSEDAESAGRLAAFLSAPLRFVPAGEVDILRVVDQALVSGQDWRDFNVHCAIVNELLAEAIEQDFRGSTSRPLVLTGDLMNEFLSDYSPVTYEGREYYRLPKLEPNALRTALIEGLDAGDREVGVFARHGIDLVQPYGLLADRYFQVPTSLICGAGGKQRLVHAVAGDLLPSWIFERPKVRAQIGTAHEPVGILPVLVNAGCDGKWLTTTFCKLLGVEQDQTLHTFIRRGHYRYLAQFPSGGVKDGYFTTTHCGNC